MGLSEDGSHCSVHWLRLLLSPNFYKRVTRWVTFPERCGGRGTPARLHGSDQACSVTMEGSFHLLFIQRL